MTPEILVELTDLYRRLHPIMLMRGDFVSTEETVKAVSAIADWDCDKSALAVRALVSMGLLEPSPRGYVVAGLN